MNMMYCRLLLERLLEENGRKLAAAKSKEKDGKILVRLLIASLVPKDTSSITVEVLKGATKLLRRRQPGVADFLRLNVNRGQMLAPLEEWVEDAVVMCGPNALKRVRTPVAIFGSLGVCIYVPASRHWLKSYSPIHLT